MAKEMRSKKGQIAIWFIVAIVIVAIIGVVFFLRQKSQLPGIEEASPEQFVKACAKEATEEALDIMLPKGGFVNPENFVTYKYN